MVANGITRARLPRTIQSSVRSTIPPCRLSPARSANTRTAAAHGIVGDRLAAPSSAIGNAPTALFRLLEMFDAGANPPAAVVGLPVGFVGAQESRKRWLPMGVCPA